MFYGIIPVRNVHGISQFEMFFPELQTPCVEAIGADSSTTILMAVFGCAWVVALFWKPVQHRPGRAKCT
jgi:hypothetical protein